MNQLKLFQPEQPKPILKIFYKDLNIHRRINVRANSLIHGLYYRGNNYAAYPLDGETIRNSFGLTRKYTQHYYLNVGWESKHRIEKKKTQLFA